MSDLFLLAWPILAVISVALVGFRLLLKLESFMYAASWAVLVITGFVAVQFALTSMGSGGVNISTGGPVAEWPSYRKDLGGSDYFPLEQISRDNVFHLEIPWEYHAGDFSDGSDERQKSSFQASSIMIEGVLYFSTIYGKVVALMLN